MNILITDATQGIGRILEQKFKDGGFNVISLMANIKNYDELCDEIYAREQDCCTNFSKTKTLDVVINTSSIDRKFAFHEYSDAAWENIINTNIKGTLNIYRATHLYLKRSKHPVFISFCTRPKIEEDNMALFASYGGMFNLLNWLAENEKTVTFGGNLDVNDLTEKSDIIYQNIKQIMQLTSGEVK